MVAEHSGTGSKKVGRGMARASLDLIEAMSRSEMQKGYRLLRIAREQGDILSRWGA